MELRCDHLATSGIHFKTVIVACASSAQGSHDVGGNKGKGQSWTPQLAAAWTEAYRIVSGLMKDGAKAKQCSMGNSVSSVISKHPLTRANAAAWAELEDVCREPHGWGLRFLAGL